MPTPLPHHPRLVVEQRPNMGQTREEARFLRGVNMGDLTPPITDIQQLDATPQFTSTIPGTAGADHHHVRGAFNGTLRMADGNDIVQMTDFSGRADVYMGDGDDTIWVTPTARAGHYLDVHGGSGQNSAVIMSANHPPGVRSEIRLYDQQSVSLCHFQNQTSPFVRVPERDWTDADRAWVRNGGHFARYVNNNGMTVCIYNRPGPRPLVGLEPLERQP